MSCVEKRHMSHRVGSMLHHRFPNGFTDLFMDDTDREVSTLTDRAFRSLCVGDDAVYNDEFLYGYSPFSCHKPLAGEPVKKTHHKEAKKQGQNKTDKNFTQSWTQQQHENLSQMSSLLKAFSATEESCEGMLIKNGATTDIKGESWDKSALRSIQRELSEFSSDYPTNLTDGHYKHFHRHHSGDGPSTKTSKDVPPPSGKSSKNKNGKPNVKLRKLNITNFFLHSELSPFQTWKDFNRFPFGQEDTVLPTDSIPKWYDLPFYKELTEAHKQETQHAEEVQPGQKALEPPPTAAPKPIPPPPPPKVLPKPSATPAGKRCSSEVGDGTAAPWRRNKSRAKSAIPLNQPGVPPQENISKQVDESLFLLKKEARSVEVKAVEEVCSLASTPFSICQLMTPLIPSRQPTETSEILQAVLSPSALDLPLRPHSEAKSTPEPPVKRESYKSLASSILFNLKDNRKRVKSRYSPPKFKTLEVPEGDSQSPQSDSVKHSQAGSEGNGSRLSTPAVFKEGFTVCSPVLESNSSPSVGYPVCDTDGPLSDDYLLSNLLQTKRETAGISEENPMSPLMHTKKTKSPMAVKQNYPSLNLYKKASPTDSNAKYLQVPPTAGAPAQINQPVETNKPSPIAINKERSPKTLPTIAGLSPNTLNVNKDSSPLISPNVLEKEGVSTNASVRKIPPTIPDKPKQPIKELRETDMGLQPVIPKERDTSVQPLSTKEVIRAAREAINAAKSRALIAAQSDRNDKTFKDKEPRESEIGKKADNSKEGFSIKSLVPENNSTGYQSRSDTTADALLKTGDVKKEPPPVPKRNFAKSDIQLALDKQQANVIDEFTNDDSGNTNVDVPAMENESNRKQAKSKHIFSARQNNYIKYHRYAETDDEHGEESKEGDVKVNTRREADEEMVSPREVKDRAHLSNDLHALKELQRAKLGDRVLDNIRNRLGVFNIDEEAKAKNDLISRELRNIKKGMLSMRGNTTAKRDIFTKKEKEQIKPEAFTKIDSNVIVNKALINDNYDKAKMALEEIISERQKRNNQKEQDANPSLDENDEDRSYITRVQQRKQAMKDCAEEAREKETGYTHSQKESDVRERLGDLRDHNHIRNILSQTEPGHEETLKSTNQTTLPGLNKTGNESISNTKTKSTFADDKLSNYPGFESEIKNLDRQLSEESGDSTVYQTGGIRKNVPPVPPRSKKGGSTTKETGSLKDFAEFDIFTNEEKCENGVERLKEMAAGSDKQEVVSDLFFKDPVHSPIETYADKKLWDMVPGTTYTFVPEADAFLTESELPLQYPLSEDMICSSPEFRQDENKANNFLSDKQTGEATLESSTDMPQVVNKVKRKAPLKPEYLKTLDNETKSLAEAGPDKISTAFEEMNIGREGHSESPSKMISPLLLVNGLSINQSPPDHASLSSKSSYFSVESALQRNTETESNVYLSLENLIGEVEGADEVKQITQLSTKRDSDRTEVEYYSLSDHESEPEFVRQAIKSPNKEETELPFKFNQEGENASTEPQDVENQTPMSPSNTFSPALGIPALFKVKDNTFSNKLKKSVQPWSPRGSFSVPTKEEEVNQVRENPKVPLINEPTPNEIPAIQDQPFKPKEILTNVSPPLLLSPPNLLTENPKKPQVGAFLAVPQEEDRFSGVSPCSEGVESVTTSTVDTADEMGANDDLMVEREVLKVPSERSGSTCSGNDSQTGLPKPPAVLPKSEKAVQRAMKLATRRMKKEEAQKTSQRSSHSSSKHRVSKHRGENPEHKSSSSSSKNSKSSERKHRERTEDGHSESHHDKDSKDLNEQHRERSHNSENPLNKQDLRQETRRQSQDSAASSNLSSEALPNAPTERQGRRNNKQIRDKPQQRHYSSDRVISNVPVYKAQVGDRTAERSFQRSMSSDRFLGDKVERRLSNDMTANERLDPRSQRIEKSIMEELQQRGRVRDKTTRDNPLRRSHSIDAYSTEVSHPSTLSRQSSHTSHTSQLSRQSSIEHAIVTQSFPMTQRKLLQDPDSGHYFFVDMPVQVKTKTFFDPETGSYVQLPVQPPEGAVPHASPLEVLTPPMVLYHGFVPVPLSPMAQKAPIQATQMTPEEFEQRHLEMSRQMLFQERHPYVEPVYGQHDHILGEFLGTEELDCPS